MSVYPFTAICGQEQAKTALLLNGIFPQIGGVLLSGEKGTAKSTMVRSLPGILTGSKLITVPLSVTEDMLVGSINVERALATGTVEYRAGLLASADGNILYVDEINLLSESAVNLLLDVASSGYCTVAREGITHTFASRFILVGSMNPEEGPIRPQILDRFGFFVELKASANIRERMDIMKRRLAYENNPQHFSQIWDAETGVLAQKIVQARSKLTSIVPATETMSVIAQICSQAFVAGHRADIAMLWGSMAMAALDGRKSISMKDIATVQSMALAHRIRNTKAPQPDNNSNDSQDDDQEPQDNNQQQQDQPQNNNAPQNNDGNTPSNASPSVPDAQSATNNEATHADCPDMSIPACAEDECFALADFKLNTDVLSHGTRPMPKLKGVGKRNKTISTDKRGRYIRARVPSGNVRDLAFDATLRIAAQYQTVRDKGLMAITITKADLRDKVRERRAGSMILFLVDASGSMGVRQRMSDAKTAVMEMLQLSYIKRDTVGMMTFRNSQSELVLSPTRSITAAKRKLEEIKTGGRTPLSAGIADAHQLIMALRRKTKEILPVVVLFTDGRETAIPHGTAAADSACRLTASAIRLIIIDTESGFLKLGLAKSIAQKSNAEYYTIDALKQKNISQVVYNTELI